MHFTDLEKPVDSIFSSINENVSNIDEVRYFIYFFESIIIGQ